jgi:hypothetical protein
VLQSILLPVTEQKQKRLMWCQTSDNVEMTIHAYTSMDFMTVSCRECAGGEGWWGSRFAVHNKEEIYFSTVFLILKWIHIKVPLEVSLLKRAHLKTSSLKQTHLNVHRIGWIKVHKLSLNYTRPYSLYPLSILYLYTFSFLYFNHLFDIVIRISSDIR